MSNCLIGGGFDSFRNERAALTLFLPVDKRTLTAPVTGHFPDAAAGIDDIGHIRAFVAARAAQAAVTVVAGVLRGAADRERRGQKDKCDFQNDSPSRGIRGRRTLARRSAIRNTYSRRSSESCQAR